VAQVVELSAELGDVRHGDPVDGGHRDLDVGRVVLDVELGAGVGGVLHRGLPVDAVGRLEVNHANAGAPGGDTDDGVEPTRVAVLAVGDGLLGQHGLDAELVEEADVALDVPGQVLG